MTLPKARLAGFDASVPADTPVPESGTFRFGFDALEVMLRLPLAAPILEGLNERANEALWPEVNVKGNVSPLRVKPLLAAALEIVTLAPPELVRVPLMLFDVPTCMLPKLNAAGLEANWPWATPVPDTANMVEAFAALLANEIEPEALPATWGANFVVKATLCPAARVTG